MENVQLMRYFGGYLSVYQRIVVKNYCYGKSKLQTSLSGGNSNLRTSLFNNVDEFDDVIKAQKRAQFETWVTNKDNILFKCIKME